MADQPLFIAKFEKALHDRSAFSCGFAPIDGFFKSSISQQIKDNLVTVWVASEDIANKSPAKGFYVLNVHSVTAAEAPQLAGRSNRPTVPAVYLNAVAVDQSCQGNGIGTALMIHAIQNAIDISELAGCAAIILDVLNDGDQNALNRRVAFYKKLGFDFIGNAEQEHRMFLSINDAKASLR
ncbi:MAG: GNAT family N-acetyltransferase [Rhodobacteraceae bacterium]|nr:GNAT family N-acetyltransferase [Paracoccaceae bacterium]